MDQGLSVNNLAQCSGGHWPSKILFENVSFHWKTPSLHVLMGSSGGGKSTFLKSIGGVWPPLKGSVAVQGHPLWTPTGPTQNPEALRLMGFAFQNNALFNSLRNLENLTFPYQKRFPETPPQEVRQIAQHWLESVGLGAHAHTFPHELSGGMQKRLAIARTLMLKPSYIFLDDPTAGLDPITSEQMGALLTNLLQKQNSLVVIVTNDPDRAKEWGPNIHFLHDGRLHSPGDTYYSQARELFLD